MLTQTPSAVRMLEVAGLGAAALVIGAEPCPPELVDRWAPGRVMVNVYGPTETTMWCVEERAADGGVGGLGWGADRVADGGGGLLCAGRVVAGGAGRCGRRVVCGRRVESGLAMCAGPV